MAFSIKGMLSELFSVALQHVTFSVQKGGWSVASYREAGAIPGGVVSLTPSTLCWLFLFLISASAVFAVSCWGCTCCCGLVCVFIRLRWAALCVALLESVGSEKGMVVGKKKKVQHICQSTDHLHVEL
jgi:hypothetical protein